MSTAKLRHLSSKFLLLTVPVIVLCALFFFTGLVWFKQREGERINLALAQKIAARDAALLSNPVWNVDEPTVRAILGSLRDDPRVHCIQLVEISGLEGEFQVGDCATTAVLSTLSSPVNFDDQGEVRRIATLLHRVDVSVDRSTLWQDLQPLVLLLLILVGAFIACALAAFRYTVRAPLDRVAASLRHYRERGERKPVAWDSADELGEFIREYNAGLLRQEQAERSLQEQLAFQRALRDTMPTPFAFLDPDWHVFDANPAFYLQLDIDPNVPIGPLSERFESVDWDTIRGLVPGGIHRVELMGLAGENHDRGFQFLTSPFLDAEGKLRGYVTIWQDITNRVTSEYALLKAKARAESALQSLQQTQQTLVQAEKLASLGSLVAGIAHEINTPVGNSLTVATHLGERVQQMQRDFESGNLRKAALAEFIASSQEACSILHRALNNAAELISKFKQVAVDQTSSQRRRFELAATVDEVLSTLRPALKHTPHHVQLEIPAGIHLDSYPGPLGQVVTNCFNNALLHGFDGVASGTIRIFAEARGSDRVSLVISDDGRGIAPENLNRVFDPFFTTRLGRGGSGLGMHLVYSIVTGLLGGQVNIDSEPGQGTRVQFDLPRCAPADRRAAAQGESQSMALH